MSGLKGQMQCPKLLSLIRKTFIPNARLRNFMAKRALLAELLGVLSCKDPRKQDGELSISIGAPSESVRCDVIVVLSDLSQREDREKMVYCVAFNCNNRSVRKPGVSFFSFPKENDLRRKWIVKVKRQDWSPTKYSKLCSDHFDNSCFISDKAMISIGWKPGRKRLKADAVPTLFKYKENIEAVKKCALKPRGAAAKRQRLEVKRYISLAMV